MIQSFRLEWDRDYGIDRRSGWTACVNGSVIVQLTTLPRAVYALVRGLWEAYRATATRGTVPVAERTGAERGGDGSSKG